MHKMNFKIGTLRLEPQEKKLVNWNLDLNVPCEKI